MTASAEDTFIASHHLVWDAEFARAECSKTIDRLKTEIAALEASVRAEKISARVAGNRGRGRPLKTPNEDRLSVARQELALATEALEIESAALQPIRAHVRELYSAQRRAEVLTGDLNSAVRAFAASLQTALAQQETALALEDEIAALKARHAEGEISFPPGLSPGARVGVRVGNVHQFCLREQIERHLEDFKKADGEVTGRTAEARKREREAFLAELAAWRGAAEAAEPKVSAVAEVQAAKEWFDMALAALNAVPAKKDGANNTERVEPFLKARAAEERYWEAICVAGHIEYRPNFCASQVPSLFED